MKTIFLFFSLLSVYSITFSQDLDDGLIYYFPFSDSIAEVQSGTTLNITGPQELTHNRFGDEACAWDISLDPNIITFEIYHSEFPNTISEFTVSVWMQLDVVDSADLGDLHFLMDLGEIKFVLTDLNTPAIIYFSNGTPILGLLDPEWNYPGLLYKELSNTNIWHHLAFTFDNGKIKLFRDGELKDSASLNDVSQIFIQDIMLGNDFSGKLDNIRIYNRALDENEIEELYLVNESCSAEDCTLFELEYGDFECLGDSIYIITIDFDHSHNSDSFKLSLRDGIFGTFAYAQLPLRIQLPFDLHSHQFISIADALDPHCSLEFEFIPDCQPTSTHNFLSQNLKVWPNPFSDRIYLNFEGNDFLNYSLYNIEGILIQQGQIVPGDSLNGESLASGLYILHLEKDGWSMEKILISR